MTIHAVLLDAQRNLESAGIPSPWLDAELLLTHLLNVPRAYLTAHNHQQLNSVTVQQYNSLITRRSRGEPLAYITGEQEFFGLTFNVTKDVLIPRPATEELVEHVRQSISPLLPPVASGKTLHSPREHGPRPWRGRAGEAERPASREAGTSVLPNGDKKIIIDIGTGSGCIAVTLAKHIPDSHIIATDISEKALTVARENARRHGVANCITFLQGDLLEPLTQTYNLPLPTANWIIVANLPYVPSSAVAEKPELSFEPKTALDGGPDGTALYRRLFKQLIPSLRGGREATRASRWTPRNTEEQCVCPALIALEVDDSMAAALLRSDEARELLQRYSAERNGIALLLRLHMPQ